MTDSEKYARIFYEVYARQMGWRSGVDDHPSSSFDAIGKAEKAAWRAVAIAAGYNDPPPQEKILTGIPWMDEDP